jgi:hypothetical protein
MSYGGPRTEVSVPWLVIVKGELRRPSRSAVTKQWVALHGQMPCEIELYGHLGYLLRECSYWGRGEYSTTVLTAGIGVRIKHYGLEGQVSLVRIQSGSRNYWGDVLLPPLSRSQVLSLARGVTVSGVDPIEKAA